MNAQRTVPFAKSEFIYACKVGWQKEEEDYDESPEKLVDE